MSCISWNCRGLGNPRAIRALRKLVQEEVPTILFLIETKKLITELDSVKRACGYDFVFGVSSEGRRGGLALLWNKNTDISLISYSKNHIDVKVKLEGEILEWRLTGFYGAPEQNQRYNSWDLMRTLSNKSSLPWCIMGDFNEITSLTEKKGLNDRAEYLMRNFKDAIDDCRLLDLGYVGGDFTWKNGQQGRDMVLERLDRSLANLEWRHAFPEATVFHLMHSTSDHCPIRMNLHFATSQPRNNINNKKNKKRLFRFEAMWVREEDCEGVIAKHWGPSENNTSWPNVIEKIKATRVGLLDWHRQKFGRIPYKIKKIQEALRDVQNSPDRNSQWDREQKFSHELNDLLEKEELRWKQRSRVSWLKEGDRNTSFFHARASHRRRKNTIQGLRGEDDVLCTERIDMERMAVTYFQNIFMTTNPKDFDEILSAIDKKVTERMNQNLTQRFTSEEVELVIKQMHPTKAPGPDGMSAIFYQKYWHIIGNDITDVCLSFLNDGQFLDKINYTYIILIPKVDKPEHMTQFRPISLCNVLYKIISKVIVNRFKQVLPHIISENQSAFIAGRQITDNIITAYELIHALKRKRSGKHGLCALKLDMSKAYDRVEWNFIEVIMLKLGFHRSWVNLIMRCVRSVSFSVLLNGEPSGFFKPSRGLRQGDPLSPYLFLLCAEGLTSLLKNAEIKGNINGVAASRGGPHISHLLFADDSIMFAKTTQRECEALKHNLNLYERASGQIVNFEKSAIFFSYNTPYSERESVKQIFGIQVVAHHEKYLGLPTMVGRSKYQAFGTIKDRVWKRIQGWREKLLSKAGKEVLVKAVAQSIPAYAMSVFRLPASLCDSLTKMMNRFWWGHTKSGRAIHWMRWERMCKPKNEGGLGFRDLQSFNMALLAKRGWRIINEPETLCHQVLKAKYFPNCHFLQAKLGNNPSLTWRSIWEGRTALERGVRWRIATGDKVSVWRDNWIPRPKTFKPVTPQIEEMNDLKVSDLTNQDSRTWNVHKLGEVFCQQDFEIIRSIPLSKHATIDRIIWHYKTNGKFDVKSAYHVAFHAKCNNAEEGLGGGASSSSEGFTKTWKRIWKSRVPNKIKIFCWRLCSNILPTNYNLAKRGVELETNCIICNHPMEDPEHVFRDCPLAGEVWLECGLSNITNRVQGQPIKAWIADVFETLNDHMRDLFLMVNWSIWLNRNAVRNGEEKLLARGICLRAAHLLAEFIQTVEEQRYNLLMNTREMIDFQPGSYRIFVDGAWDKSTGKGGVGVVILSAEGEFKAARAIPIPVIISSDAVEALAIQEGLIMAKELQIARCSLYCDNKTVVESCADQKDCFASFGAIIDGVKFLSKDFNVVSFCFITRLRNGLAHKMAYVAKSISCSLSWTDSAPLELVDMI